MSPLWHLVRLVMCYCTPVAQNGLINWSLSTRCSGQGLCLYSEWWKEAEAVWDFFLLGCLALRSVLRTSEVPRTMLMLAVGATVPWEDSQLCDSFSAYWPVPHFWINHLSVIWILQYTCNQLLFVTSTWINLCWLIPRTELGTEDGKSSWKYVEFKLSAGTYKLRCSVDNL